MILIKLYIILIYAFLNSRVLTSLPDVHDLAALVSMVFISSCDLEYDLTIDTY